MERNLHVLCGRSSSMLAHLPSSGIDDLVGCAIAGLAQFAANEKWYVCDSGRHAQQSEKCKRTADGVNGLTRPSHRLIYVVEGQ